MKNSFLEFEKNLDPVGSSFINPDIKRQSLLLAIEDCDIAIDMCDYSDYLAIYLFTDTKLLLINELEQLL